MIDDDYEIDIDLTKKTRLLNNLKSLGLLDYGKKINVSDIEKIFECQKKNVSDEAWSIMILNLTEIIKDQGYFYTQRGQEDRIYILQAQEMADDNARKCRIMFRNLKRRQRALHMIDPALLTKEQQKKLEFETLRNADIELAAWKKLNGRCRY